jgi:hypothetical protein
MKNGRCRHHGGKSTGPRTEAGRARLRKANLKHGRHIRARREASAAFTEMTRILGRLWAAEEAGIEPPMELTLELVEALDCHQKARERLERDLVLVQEMGLEK